MSYNGSGTFVVNTAGQPVVTGTIISSTAFNALTADLATGLSTAVTKDGQTTPTANLPMGGFKLTGLGNGTAATDSAAFGQVLASSYTTTATAAGTTVLSATSNQSQYFTGATTQTITLPDVTTLPALGFQFRIVNLSSGSLTVNSSGGNLVATVTANQQITLTCILLTGTTAASWDVKFSGATAITGTGSAVRATNPALVGYTVNTASGVDGEWTTAGLTVYKDGVTPQHDGPLHVMSGTAGTWTADSGSVIVAESAVAGGISIGTPDAITGTLSFSSPTKTAASGALVQFNYTSGVFGFRTFKVGAEMQFKTGNDTAALTLNSSQQTLHTVGSVSAPSISFSGYADTGIHMVTDGSGNNMVFGSSGGEIFRAGMYTPATPDIPRITIANGYTGDPGVGGSLTFDSKAVRATDTGNGIVFNVPTSTSGGASEDMVVLKAVCSNSTNGARQGDLVCYTRNTSQDYAWRAYYNGNFTVRGALAKGSGSFNIEHPHPDKKDTHRLVHGFIEGPRNDLIYRGVISMVNGWATVDLDAVSGMTSGTWVLLCRDPLVFATASGWAKVRGTVVGATLTLESDDKTYSELANWIVIAERHDEHIMDVDTTDDEGHLIVEPLMTEEQLIARERTRAAAEARAAEAEAEAATIH